MSLARRFSVVLALWTATHQIGPSIHTPATVSLFLRLLEHLIPTLYPKAVQSLSLRPLRREVDKRPVPGPLAVFIHSSVLRLAPDSFVRLSSLVDVCFQFVPPGFNFHSRRGPVNCMRKILLQNLAECYWLLPTLSSHVPRPQTLKTAQGYFRLAIPNAHTMIQSDGAINYCICSTVARTP
jgi:hypothetical protein